MRRIYILFALMLVAQQFSAQNPPKIDPWNLLLNDVKVKYSFSFQYDGLMPKPKFGSKLMELNGKQISLQGFFLPVDLTGDVFVLSYNPMSSCFFCNGSGIQTIVELIPAEGQEQRLKRLKTDNFFEVKGKLKLNPNDYTHLIYILENAEFVRLVR
jgi:hypothetical protein